MNFKNLLPVALRPTRWGAFAEVLGDVFTELKEIKISRIKNKYKVRESDEENLRSLLALRGFPEISYEGFTDTLDYWYRRNESYPYERSYRTAVTSYQYFLKSLWMIGSAYSLRKNEDDQFVIVRNPVESVNSLSAEFFSDQAADLIYYYLPDNQTPINSVPNPPVPSGLPDLLSDSDDEPESQRILTLDSNLIRDFTNHFVVEWNWLVLEDEDLWMSEGTAHAMYDTVLALKRQKEVPHFQPIIKVPLVTDSVNTVTWGTPDGIITSDQYTIHKTGTALLDIAKVKIGRGRNYTVTTGTPQAITDLNIPVVYYSPLDDFFFINGNTPLEWDIEYIMEEYSFLEDGSNDPYYDISEVGFFDASDNLIAYSYFPTIHFYREMYSSIRFIITLV